jgi:hypothetical protein
MGRLIGGFCPLCDGGAAVPDTRRAEEWGFLSAVLTSLLGF